MGVGLGFRDGGGEYATVQVEKKRHFLVLKHRKKENLALVKDFTARLKEERVERRQ